jgi:MEMO1 family protein
MLRLPAVAGRFYPANPKELATLVQKYTQQETLREKVKARACLVPHAGYMYSGAVAGAVFARIALPRKVLLLGVRHYPRGEELAILSKGSWRTPLGDVPIDPLLANSLLKYCPSLRDDSLAHSKEHSLEVELPFLQILSPGCSFVPVAVGTERYERLQETGEGVARALKEAGEEILMVTSSDMNHYEDDETTRQKDEKAIERMLKIDAQGLYDVCRTERVSMCGLGPAVTMLTALNHLGGQKAELVRYATSGDVSGNRKEVVGYAGLMFS